MKSIVRYVSKFLFVAVIGLAVACGDGNRTGTDAGEVNHEDPGREKQDETGDLPTEEEDDGSHEAEDEPTGVDTTNTDSTQVNPRMQRKQ